LVPSEDVVAIIDLRDGRVVGSISFIDIRHHDRGVEIGWAWLAPRVWGDGFNAEAMLLLMKHAFETLGAIRVAIKADVRNVRSIRSMERIGASREGVWRNHRILSDGFHRDSVYYSVIDTEWPKVAEGAQDIWVAQAVPATTVASTPSQVAPSDGHGAGQD
jgi:RimJ/RimL family protein N-acetyltransferase